MAVLEEHGYFWWSDEQILDGHLAPNNAVPGFLTIGDDGIAHLDLHGVLTKAENALSAMFFRESVDEKQIIGILKASDKHVMLWELARNGSHAASRGISFEGYYAFQALVGSEPFQKTTNIAFSGFKVNLNGFENWLRLGGISSRRTKVSFAAKAKIQVRKNYSLPNGSASILYGLKSPWGTEQYRHELHIEETAHFEYRARKNLTFNQITNQVSGFSDLLVILSGSSRSLDWPWLYVGRGKRKLSYQHFYSSTRNSSPAPKPFDYWIVFPSIADKFGDLLSRWEKANDELGTGVQLYVGTVKSDALHLEHKFVNLIWGIEVLHRSKNPETEQPSDFKIKIDRILSDIKIGKDKAWLKKRLATAHEPSLKERLVWSIETLGLPFEKNSLDDFCKICADLRNDISHFGGQRTFENYHDLLQALHDKTSALLYLYHAIILREIGIDHELLHGIFLDSRHSGKITREFSIAGLNFNSEQNPGQI